jgi:hypothetical protein
MTMEANYFLLGLLFRIDPGHECMTADMVPWTRRPRIPAGSITRTLLFSTAIRKNRFLTPCQVPLLASTSSHERQPLLGTKGSEPAITTTYGDPERGGEVIEIERAPLKPEPTSRWTSIVYAVSGVLGTAFMYILIKGFVESDDMEVS